MKNQISFFTAIIILIFSVFPAQSTEIGVATIRGKKIIINDDGTWIYAKQKLPENTAQGDCESLPSEVVPVSICLNQKQWKFANINNQAEYGFNHAHHPLFLMFISEKMYLTKDIMKSGAILHAQQFSGLTKVKILEEKQIKIGKHAFTSLVYTTKIKGVDFTYHNVFSSFKGHGSVQFLFFSGAQEFIDLRKIIDHTIGQIEVNF